MQVEFQRKMLQEYEKREKARQVGIAAYIIMTWSVDKHSAFNMAHCLCR